MSIRKRNATPEPPAASPPRAAASERGVRNPSWQRMATRIADPRSPADAQPLPDPLAEQFSRAAGPGVAELRIHPNAESLGPTTRALTVGPDLHFGAGEYRPDTERGRELIAHEVAHGLQQRAGGDGAPTPGPAHEHNARQVAGRLLAGRTVGPGNLLPSATGPAAQEAGSDPVIEIDELSFSVPAPYAGERYEAVDYEQANRLNPFWDQRLKAFQVAPFAPIDAIADPVEYANVVYRFQKWVQFSDLDKQLVDKRLIRDGVLGPRTLRLIAAVATHPDQAAMVASAERRGFSGAMVERWQALPAERWEQMSLSAGVELDEPEIAASWSPGTIGFDKVIAYWRHHGIDPAMDLALDRYFEVEPGATITDAMRFTALQLLFEGTQWEVYYTVLTTPREQLERIESERMVQWQLDEAYGDASLEYLYFGVSTADSLAAVERLLAPDLPSSGDAATILAQLAGASPPTGASLPAVTIGFCLPDTTSVARRLAAYEAFVLPDAEAELELDQLLAAGEKLGDDAEAARLRAQDDPSVADVDDPEILLELLSNGNAGQGDASELEFRLGLRTSDTVCYPTRPFLIVNLATDDERRDAFILWLDDIIRLRQQAIEYIAEPLEFGNFRNEDEHMPGVVDQRYFDARTTDDGVLLIRGAPPSKMSSKSLESLDGERLHPLQPVNITIGRYFPGKTPVVAGLVTALGGDHEFRTDPPRWVFAAQLPRVAEGLYEEKTRENYAAAFDVGMTTLGLALVGVAPAVWGLEGAGIAGRAWPAVRELAFFAGGEMLSQYLTESMYEVMTFGTEEEKAAMQAKMRGIGIATLALLAVGGGMALRGRSAATMQRAIATIDPSTRTLVQHMGASLSSLGGDLLRSKQVALHEVKMVETSNELVRSTLPARLMRNVEVVIDPDLLPGAIRVTARDAIPGQVAAGGGAILRVSNVIRPHDLKLHIPYIKAARGYIGAERIWARIRQLLTEPLPGFVRKSDPTAAALDRELIAKGLLSSPQALEEAAAESVKLGTLVEERLSWIASGQLADDEARVALLEAQLMNAQLSYFEAVLDGRQVMRARGYVAWDPAVDSAAMAERLAAREFSGDLIPPEAGLARLTRIIGELDEGNAAGIRTALAQDQEVQRLGLGQLGIRTTDDAGTMITRTVDEWLAGLDDSVSRAEVLAQLGGHTTQLHELVYLGQELTFRRGNLGGMREHATVDDVEKAGRILEVWFDARPVGTPTKKHLTYDIEGWGRWRVMFDDKTVEFRLPPMTAEMEQRLASEMLPTLYEKLAQRSLFPDAAAGGGHIHIDAAFALQNPELMGRFLGWYMHMEQALHSVYTSSNRSRGAAQSLLGHASDPDFVDQTLRTLGSDVDRNATDVAAALGDDLSPEFYERLTGIGWDPLGADAAREWSLNVTTFDPKWEKLYLGTAEFRFFDAPATPAAAAQHREIVRELLSLAFSGAEAPASRYRGNMSHEAFIEYLRGQAP